MSLTRAQKEFIEASIDHFLDFPAESALLLAEISKLKNAFSNPHDQKNDYHQLSRCLFKPAKNFQRLETYNNAGVTVGIVQAYIIDLITERLAAAAEKAKISLRENGWDAEKLKQQMILPEHHRLPFKSVNISIDNRILPYHRITDEGKVFTAALVPRENEPYVGLQVDVELPDGMHTITDDHFRVIPAGDYHEDVFMSLLIPEAKLEAYDIALTAVLHFLQDATLITPGFAVLAVVNVYLKKILTDQFYLDLILDRKINLSSMTLLTAAQINALLEPVVKSLIADKFLQFIQAAHLKKTEIMVASRYYSLLRQKKIHMEQITNIRENQAKILLLPLIINLINKGSLSFDTAKRLPPHLRQLLSSDLYMDHFFKEDINWERMTLLTKEQCDFFLNARHSQGIASLVKNKIFSIADIIFYTSRTLQLMKEPRIIKLLLNKTVSIDDLSIASEESVSLIITHPHLSDWISAGLISMNHLYRYELADLHAEIYSKRLLSLHMNKPVILRGIVDSIEKISIELPFMVELAKTDLTTLRERIIRKFMRALDERIKTLLASNIPQQERNTLIELQQKVGTITSNAVMTATLSDLLTTYDKYFEEIISKDKAQAAKMRYSLFTHNNLKTNLHVFTNLIIATEFKEPVRPQ